MNIPSWVQISVVALAYLVIGVCQVAVISYFRGKKGLGRRDSFDLMLMVIMWPALDIVLVLSFITEMFGNLMWKIYSLGERQGKSGHDRADRGA